MWLGWRVTLSLFALGAALLSAGFGYAVVVNGFPAPIQDMGKATPEQLDDFYGRPPTLANALGLSGCWVVVASTIIGAVGVVRLIHRGLRAEKDSAADGRS